MNHIKHIIMYSAAALIGILLFFFQQEWIVIRFPYRSTQSPNALVKIKKPIAIHFWHDNRWHIEKQDLLLSNDTADNLFYLTTNWLNTLDTEEVTSQKVVLQTATVSPSGTDAYLSFDRSPFDSQWSIFKKWMWVEGLLKTVHEQKIPVQNIYLLVHHKPLLDRHIDGSQPWPTCGFLSLSENQLQ